MGRGAPREGVHGGCMVSGSESETVKEAHTCWPPSSLKNFSGTKSNRRCGIENNKYWRGSGMVYTVKRVDE
jgi:hypothetical protein